MQKEIEELFINRFKNSGYRILVQHNVDQLKLYNILHDSQNIALFFVEHSKKESFGINDYQNNNILPIFKDIHPNMRFLGLISCNTERIFKTFLDNSTYK